MTDIALIQKVFKKDGDKVDMDKETVQFAAIICGTTVAVAALVFDGELGYAMGTSILTLGGTAVGYLFGKKDCEVKE